MSSPDERILSGRYKIDSELGRGGMGVVYGATDLQLNRRVAVKLLPPSLAQNRSLLARFKNEVTNTGRLDHRNIGKVYDVGEQEGTNFYVMELIEGSDLRSEIEQHGKLPLETACSYLAEMASALDYAHSRGIIHRDIKPENVLIDASGSIRIVDFGIAQAVGATRLTGGMVGTPEYISPEQARGQTATGATDQYALAVMAYELLTGLPPFRTDISEPWALINMHIADEPADPRTLAPELPAHAAEALLRALEKAPEDRFASCTDFVQALAGEAAFKPRRRSKRHASQPSLVGRALVGLAVVSLLLVSGFFWAKGNNPQAPSTTPEAPAKQAGPVTTAEASSFVQDTWLPALKSGQIGTFTKCYDQARFEAREYTSKTVFTSQNFDTYLAQWLSKDWSGAQLSGISASQAEDKGANVELTLNSGATGKIRKRITLGRGFDNGIVVVREVSAPASVSLDQLK